MTIPYFLTKKCGRGICQNVIFYPAACVHKHSRELYCFDCARKINGSGTACIEIPGSSSLLDLNLATEFCVKVNIKPGFGLRIEVGDRFVNQRHDGQDYFVHTAKRIIQTELHGPLIEDLTGRRHHPQRSFPFE